MQLSKPYENYPSTIWTNLWSIPIIAVGTCFVTISISTAIWLIKSQHLSFGVFLGTVLAACGVLLFGPILYAIIHHRRKFFRIVCDRHSKGVRVEYPLVGKSYDVSLCKSPSPIVYIGDVRYDSLKDAYEFSQNTDVWSHGRCLITVKFDTFTVGPDWMSRNRCSRIMGRMLSCYEKGSARTLRHFDK